MNLRRQSRTEYNRKNYDNIFNITDETQSNGITLLQLNSDNFETTEDTFDKVDAKCMFLTETQGQKEGLNKENHAASNADPNNVTNLAKYLFLTEQMECGKRLKVFGESWDKVVKDELQHINDMGRFHPKHRYDLTREE